MRTRCIASCIGDCVVQARGDLFKGTHRQNSCSWAARGSPASGPLFRRSARCGEGQPPHCEPTPRSRCHCEAASGSPSCHCLTSLLPWHVRRTRARQRHLSVSQSPAFCNARKASFDVLRSAPVWSESVPSSGYHPGTSTARERRPTETVCRRTPRRRTLPVSGWMRVSVT